MYKYTLNYYEEIEGSLFALTYTAEFRAAPTLPNKGEDNTGIVGNEHEHSQIRALAHLQKDSLPCSTDPTNHES